MPASKTELELKVDREAAEFWKKRLGKTDYILLTPAVRNELRDFYYIIQQLPLVYCHVTGGVLSKHMYPAETVNAVADEHVERMCDSAVGDFKLKLQIIMSHPTMIGEEKLQQINKAITHDAF